MAATKTARTILAAATNLAAETEKSVTSITRSGTTATATITSHGFSNGDVVIIAGAVQSEYNGVFAISNVATNTFDYTLRQDPGASASGTITCWRGKRGTAVDLTTKYGLTVVGRIQNGATGPTAGLKVLCGLANANNEYDYVWREIMAGDNANLAYSPIHWGLGPSVMYANFFFYGNTGQAVDAELFGHELTTV